MYIRIHIHIIYLLQIAIRRRRDQIGCAEAYNDEIGSDVEKLKYFDINMFKEERAKKLVRFHGPLVTDNYVRVILKRSTGV